MANPSTEGGTGAGTEVLRRKWFRKIENTPVKLIDGVADHIYTVLSISWHNRLSPSMGIVLYINPEADADNDIKIFHQDAQIIPSYGTFIFNDKLVLTGTDELLTRSESGTDVIDVWISYIDQTFA